MLNNRYEDEDDIETDDDYDGFAGVEQRVPTPANFRNGDELIIQVTNFSGVLPVFPIPETLPMGRYTIVYQVMSKNDILSRTEKALFYLADADFSFRNINAHLPGIASSNQLIPKGTVIMLEADVEYDSRLNPYIVWYNGRRVIGEGSISDGAGNLIWKTPEQSGFFSLRAEVFPAANYQDLTGYQKGISLLVSSKKIDFNLSFGETPDMLYRYLFEGDLTDSKENDSPDREIQPVGDNSPVWKPSGGTYGLASGPDNSYILPHISFSGDREESWKILFRFKSLNEGGILTAQFGPSFNVKMNLVYKDGNLILSLISPAETVSQTVILPESDEFISCEINFSLSSGELAAKLDAGAVNSNRSSRPISIKANVNNILKIMLGISGNTSSAAAQRNRTPVTVSRQVIYTALWDELAFFSASSIEPEADAEQPEQDAEEQDSDEQETEAQDTEENISEEQDAGEQESQAAVDAGQNEQNTEEQDAEEQGTEKNDLSGENALDNENTDEKNKSPDDKEIPESFDDSEIEN
ncbi:MAG: hypothetical protein LBH16_04100 [Treponema sp.]|nr:hypothetical protein [Treponema sp.]